MKKQHMVLLSSLEHTPLFRKLRGNGVEHAGLDEDDGDEGCKIKAWRGRNPPLSLAKVWDWQSRDLLWLLAFMGRDIGVALARPKSTHGQGSSTGMEIVPSPSWDGGQAAISSSRAPGGWQHCPSHPTAGGGELSGTPSHRAPCPAPHHPCPQQIDWRGSPALCTVLCWVQTPNNPQSLCKAAWSRPRALGLTPAMLPNH